MLDINYYRFAEEKAKNSLSTWRIPQKIAWISLKISFIIKILNTSEGEI